VQFANFWAKPDPTPIITLAKLHRALWKLCRLANCAQHRYACLSMPVTIQIIVRHDTCPHNCAVKRQLVVGLPVNDCCNQPYCLTAIFRPTLSYVVSEKLLPVRSTPTSCKSAQNWDLSNQLSVNVASSVNHVVDTCPLMKFEIELQLFHTVQGDALCWLETVVTTALTKWMTKRADSNKLWLMLNRMLTAGNKICGFCFLPVDEDSDVCF